MAKPHVIDNVEVDIAFDRRAAAFEQQDALAGIVKDELLPVVDEVLETYSTPGQVIRIETLELDLGTVPYQGYAQTLRQRLRDRLTTWLEEHCGTSRQGRTGTVQRVSADQAALQQLQYFLLNGRWPWHGREQDVDALMHNVLRDNGRQLAAFLTSTARRDDVVRRLTQQFSPRRFPQLIRMLVPDRAAEWCCLIEALSEVLHNRVGAGTAPTWQRGLWAEAFTAALHSRSKAQPIQVLLMEMVRTAARQGGWPVPMVLKKLMAYLGQRVTRDPAQRVLMQWLDRVSEEDAVEVDDAAIVTPADTPSNITESALRQRWITALTTGSGAEIEQLWPELLQYPGMTVEVLKRYGHQADIHAKLAAQVSETVLESMVTLLAPDEHRFISEIVEQEALFHPVARVDGQGGERVKRQLWAFTLDYLLVDRGSQFNRKSYLGSVLRAKAAHDNVHFSDLLTSLTEVLEHVMASSQLKRDLLALLSELSGRDEPLARPSPVDAADKTKGPVAGDAETSRLDPDEVLLNASWVQAHAHFDLLKAVLIGQRLAVSSNDIEIAIQALDRDHPAVLLKLFRELQVDETAVAALGQGLSVDAARLLTESYLRMSDKSGGAQPSHLRLAVQHYARQVTDRRRYYVVVLQCLLANRLLDFEQLVADGDAVSVVNAEDTAVSGASLADAGATGIELSLEHAKAVLSKLLPRDVFDIRRQLDTVVAALNTVLTQAPGFLRQLPGGPVALAPLADHLPQPVLGRVVLALSPASRQLMTAADSITTALYGARPRVSPVVVEQAKWRYVLQCLAHGGRPGEGTFVRGLVAALEQRLGIEDATTFRGLLSQQLLQDVLPSTRALHRRLVDALSGADKAQYPLPVEQASLTKASADESTLEFTEIEWVHNAGLVLLAPYLPRLFDMMGIMAGTVFNDEEAAGWAVHLLQYLADERCDAPEHGVLLNKILCGLPTTWPVVAGIELSDGQRQIADSLLQGVIDNWTALGSTSVAGLRESFLQREGQLQFRDDSWHLTVTPRAYDMLLDRLPWGISTLRQPWMRHVVYVHWR